MSIEIEREQDVVEDTTEVVEKPAKKKIKKSRASWKPANLIEIPAQFRDPGYVYYLANTRHTGRVEQKLREGWEIDKYIIPKMRKAGYLLELPASIEDGQPKDNTLRFRELICLRTTQENADAREEYYRSIDPIKRANEKFHGETGGRSYGKIITNR